MFSSKKKLYEIKLEDSANLLYSETRKEFEESEKKIRPLISDLIVNLSDLRTAILNLKEKVVPDTYANSAKNKYCERSLDNLNTTMPNFSHSDVMAFIQNTDKMLKIVENPELKEMRHLFAFKSEMSSVSECTKTVRNSLSKLRKNVDKPFLENRDKTEKCINWMIDMKNKGYEILSKVEDMKEQEKVLFSELMMMKKDIDDVKKEFEESRMESVNKEIEHLEKQRNSIKQRIDTDFGSIMRPIRKAVHDAENGIISFTKEEKRIANDYSMSEETFLSSDNDNMIRTILEKTKDAIDSKKLIVDDKEKDKLNMIFRSLDFFITLKDQYIHVLEKIDEKEKFAAETFGPFFKKRNDLETKISEKQKEIEQLKKVMHATNEDKIRLSIKMKNDVEVLELNFMRLGIEAKIAIE